jgi:hypothetical protein
MMTEGKTMTTNKAATEAWATIFAAADQARANGGTIRELGIMPEELSALKHIAQRLATEGHTAAATQVIALINAARPSSASGWLSVLDLAVDVPTLLAIEGMLYGRIRATGSGSYHDEIGDDEN